MNKSKNIITDALGFTLDVTITVGDFSSLGEHRTYENYDTGKVDRNSPHKINIKRGLDSHTACLVAAHEAYHLFRSIAHLITADEETEAEAFGELVSKIFKFSEGLE